MPLRNADREPRENEAVYCEIAIDTGRVIGPKPSATTANVEVVFDRFSPSQQRSASDLFSIEQDVIKKKRLKVNPHRDGNIIVKVEAWITRNKNRYLEIRKFVERPQGSMGGCVEVLRFRNGIIQRS